MTETITLVSSVTDQILPKSGRKKTMLSREEKILPLIISQQAEVGVLLITST